MKEERKERGIILLSSKTYIYIYLNYVSFLSLCGENLNIEYCIIPIRKPIRQLGTLSSHTRVQEIQLFCHKL